MSPPSLAPVAALEKRLGLAVGSLSGSDLARAEEALADASALVRAEAGKDWVADDGVTITAPDVVVVVTRQAALRQYGNPEGHSGESIDGGTYSWQTTGPTDVYLTDDEKTLVRRAAAGERGGFTGTVRTPSAYGDDRYPYDPGRFYWGLP